MKYFFFAFIFFFSFNASADYLNSNMVEKCRPIAEQTTEKSSHEEALQGSLCYGFFAFMLDLNNAYFDSNTSKNSEFDKLFLNEWFPCRFNGSVPQYIYVYVDFIDKNKQYLNDYVTQIIGLAQDPYCPKAN